MEILLKIENLSASFGIKEILKNINLEIRCGETFALIGPSGAGKTTLLRILDFLEKPANGNLKFNSLSGEDKNIRYMMSLLFQNPAIFNASVFENVAFGLKVRKCNKNTVERKVHDALDIVGLAGMEKQNARTLSGGEAQRMAFARAIVYDPKILLLDEPTANLDPVNVAKIEEIIKGIRTRQGTTIIIATHNIPQVRRIADRVGILLDGEMIEVNTVEGIFTAPKDARSAAFMKGKMIY